jgi:hypothetical protein
VFTARYALSPYIKQIRFIFKGLMMVRSCNALLRMLLLCIRSYLKSVLRHRFLILGTCHPATLYVPEQGCEDSCLVFEGKVGPRGKMFGKHSLNGSKDLNWDECR